MKELDIYKAVSRQLERKSIDADCIVPVIEDMKKCEPILYNKLLTLMREYKTSLAERIMDSRQVRLFAPDSFDAPAVPPTAQKDYQDARDFDSSENEFWLTLCGI